MEKETPKERKGANSISPLGRVIREHGLGMDDVKFSTRPKDLPDALRKQRSLLSVRDLARLKRRHPESIRRMVRKGYPHIRDGRQIFFDPLKVADEIEKHSCY